MKRPMVRWAVGLVLLGTLAPAWAQESSWTEVLEFSLLLVGHEDQDFSRDSPPFGRHVWVLPSFENLSDRTVSAVEARFRFIDAFGDVLHVSESVKLQYDLMPGEVGVSTQMLYYEQNEFAQGPYDALLGPAQIDALKAEVAVDRVAFGDGVVVSFREEWTADEFSRLSEVPRSSPSEREFAPPSYSFEFEGDAFDTDPVAVSTQKWAIAWLTFDGRGQEVTLVVSRDGVVVASETFDAGGMSDALILESGPGTFEIAVTRTGRGQTTVVVQEAQP